MIILNFQNLSTKFKIYYTGFEVFLFVKYKFEFKSTDLTRFIMDDSLSSCMLYQSKMQSQRRRGWTFTEESTWESHIAASSSSFLRMYTVGRGRGQLTQMASCHPCGIPGRCPPGAAGLRT